MDYCSLFTASVWATVSLVSTRTERGLAFGMFYAGLNLVYLMISVLTAIELKSGSLVGIQWILTAFAVVGLFAACAMAYYDLKDGGSLNQKVKRIDDDEFKTYMTRYGTDSPASPHYTDIEELDDKPSETVVTRYGVITTTKLRGNDKSKSIFRLNSDIDIGESSSLLDKSGDNSLKRVRFDENVRVLTYSTLNVSRNSSIGSVSGSS